MWGWDVDLLQYFLRLLDDYAFEVNFLSFDSALGFRGYGFGSVAID